MEITDYEEVKKVEYRVEEGLLNEVLNYIAKRPYIEVFKLVSQLQSCEKIEEKPTKKHYIRCLK